MVEQINQQLLRFSPCYDRISIICFGNKCLYSNIKTNKSDDMIELELEEIPQNCIQEVDRSEKPKN